MNLLQKFNQAKANKILPSFKVGDTIRVFYKIKEGDKERMQNFEGLVIAKKHGKSVGATFTVRKIVDGIGVERIFPLHSSKIGKVEVVKTSKVRRAKIYFVCQKSKKMKTVTTVNKEKTGFEKKEISKQA
jgi:large subunit ribosomal protein L19